MAVDRRKKDVNWYCADEDGGSTPDQADRAVLMDIRDELRAIRRLAECYRIPRALDAMHELGVAARRAKRTAAAKRKAKKS